MGTPAAHLLRGILDETLRRCDPASLTRAALESATDVATVVDVIALGKCSAGLLRGTASLQVRRSFVCVPAGYPPAEGATELWVSSHPEVSAASFAAGENLLRFIDPSFPTVFLISGGSSACVEAPLKPWFAADDLVEINRLMLRSGLAIESINTVRKHLSAIKGGRLGVLAGPSVTFVLSDVAPGFPHVVGSGPTLGDPTTLQEAATILRGLPGAHAARAATTLESGEVPETPKRGGSARPIGDNSTLLGAAADEIKRHGLAVRTVEAQMSGDVEAVARDLFALATTLAPGEIAVAGGEPTVVIRGDGRGGRCGEVAARFALRCLEEERRDLCGLFAASDGVDGNSETAGAIVISGGSKVTPEEIHEALERSDSRSILEKIGEPILLPATGNNLRDLFLITR